jgi:hypothetical protein
MSSIELTEYALAEAKLKETLLAGVAALLR